MLAEFIELIQKTYQKTETMVIDGANYKVVPNHVSVKLAEPPTPEALSVMTLSGIVNYLNFNLGLDLIAHIRDYQTVRVVSTMDGTYKTRETHLEAHCAPLKFGYNHFMGLEDFNISAMRCFYKDNELVALLKFLGSVQAENQALAEDDGVTQKVTVRKGVASLSLEKVPNPIMLRPYVTFSEIDQPRREFVFRMRGSDNEMQAALFEVSSDEWRADCVRAIARHLVDNVSEVMIIS